MDDDSEHKKAKGTKKCVIKRGLMVKNYKDCIFNDKTMIKTQQRFKSDHHDVYTEQINKIALSSDDDKRLQTFDKIATYPYGTHNFKVYETDMMMVRSLIIENFTDCSFYDEIILQKSEFLKKQP